MTVSPEIQATVDKIRDMRQREKADAAADALREKQMAELQTKYDAAQEKLDAIPVNRELSQEDKDALQHAFDEVQDAKNAMEETHDELKDAVPANTDAAPAAAQTDDAAAKNAQDIAEARGREKAEGPKDPEPIQAPLMPTLAFDPTGGTQAPAGGGQPAQDAPIETAGGFVIQGGASTQRAPGSMPDSPSSSVAVPEDPTAKAPANNADLVKSGVGDSRGDEQIGNDLKPASDSPGMPKEPTEAEQKAAQDLKDAQDAEMAKRQDNPLNLSPEDQAKRDAEANPPPAAPPNS